MAVVAVAVLLPDCGFCEPLARPGLSGKLHLRDRQGRSTAGLNAALDGQKRAYFEGGTLAAAVWLIEGLRSEHLAEGMAIDMDFRAVRDPYGPSGSRRILASVALRNPRTALQQTVAILDLSKGRRCVVPRRIEKRRGAPQQVDLVEDLVDNGRVEVVVHSLDRRQFIGMREQDLRLSQPNGAAPQPLAAPAGDLESLPAGPPYARALAACRGAWRQYHAAVIKMDTAGLPSHVIFIDREQQIARQTEAVLAGCLAALRPEVQAPKSATPCLQAATLSMMLDKDDEAVPYLEKAASLDKRYQSAMLYMRGKYRFGDARLVEALDDLREAVRLDPGNADAVARLRKVCEMMDEKVPDDLAAAVSKAKPAADPTVQVLPWRRIYALDPELAKLGKPIPGAAEP